MNNLIARINKQMKKIFAGISTNNFPKSFPSRGRNIPIGFIRNIIPFYFICTICVAKNVEFTKNNFPGKEEGLNEALNNIKKGDNFFKLKEFKELNVNAILKRQEQTVTIQGIVMDEKGKALRAKIEVVNNASGKIIASTSADNRGEYSLKFNAGKNYGMSVSDEGFIFQSIHLDIPPGIYHLNLPTIILKNIEAGSNIVLNNIFFDFDTALLHPDSKPELQRVADALQANPSMKVEISGHTDSKGSATRNLMLSESRAKSVVDFLVSAGIAKARLSYRGFGFLNPIASNETEEGRKLNQRTEFKIMAVNAYVRQKATEPVYQVKKLPADIAPADKNHDGKISADEIITLINLFFEGGGEYTLEKINRQIDLFFEQ